ncbi:hypothetical protein [Hydrotalea sandarakina]|jgi:uncharacterized coiled-coil DUF342 family protein|uniref:Uncharacterized protein n=1 Tax=Hydrotalea sandarakina TaxID=1004304 RepID=A0A2W7S369_9BACT|nr:hypothetical protein [Hydrotalea sandarakina]PZX65516.1 hypothetical protein LX80_00004 [Hydrotalea sandarakina]
MLNEPLDHQPKQKKDKRNLVYSLFVVLLLGTWAYIIYDKSVTTHSKEQLQTQINAIDSSRAELKLEFNATSARLDSLTGKHIQLIDKLADKNKTIQHLKNTIAGLLQKQNITATQLLEARKMIDELNGKVNDLYNELALLQNKNQALTLANEQLNNEKLQLQDTLNKTVAYNQYVTNEASTLHASNFSIEALKVHNNGKEKMITVAKKTDLLRISFDLDANRIAPSGEKELFICIVSPDGKIITSGNTITTRLDGTIPYTTKVTVQYEQGKTASVNINWRNNGNYEPGDYTIIVYQNGYKIGQGSILLKKSGIFG